MKPAYERDRSLEDKFARVIKCVLGLQFFGRTEWADTREGTDFAIFSSTPVRVAVRLRRQKFYEKYPDDVTIRWSRPSGIDTAAVHLPPRRRRNRLPKANCSSTASGLA